MTDTFAARPDLGMHLANVASLLRDMAGGSRWDVPGIRIEILKAKHLAPPDQLAHAVIAWATTRLDLRAPIGLADDGPHWHTGRTPDARVEAARCTHPGHEYERIPCRLCPVERYEPTDRPTLGNLSDAQRAINTRGLALVRAVAAGEPAPAIHPDTPPTAPSDAAMRAANDREDD